MKDYMIQLMPALFEERKEVAEKATQKEFSPLPLRSYTALPLYLLSFIHGSNGGECAQIEEERAGTVVGADACRNAWGVWTGLVFSLKLSVNANLSPLIFT